MPIHGEFTPYDLDRVNKAIAYMEENFTESISAEALAMEVGIDIKLLQKIMQDITGKTIHNYLLQVRLNHSLIALADFSMPISTVARKVGFSDHAHFDRVFKKHKDQTPTQYREQLMRNRNSLDGDYKNHQ